MSSTAEIASAFIKGAPPGELGDVVADLKTLTSDSNLALIQSLKPAFQSYNEDQLTTIKLPGSSQSVLISKYNRLGDGKYFDVESNSSWDFDHITQKASNVQSYTDDSPNSDLIKSLSKSLSSYASEHYPASTYGVYPDSSSSGSIAILLVANKYSPNNFWNGRWRSIYTFDPSSSTLSGTLQVHIHYYEDGNVALTTNKPVSISVSSPSAPEILRKIAATEKQYQEELNKEFVKMNDSSFKALRRQLPVTRQKVEWEKVGGYKLGSDLRGGGR
ncbi:putative f-actin-capping protein subunit alpha [Phaeomoniella chlamydospora]|uniref:F-actin-capping protein subunit alpha n=1 Tax=Phaeomoniella chlamydospora TaxID=158046 RepID=A0A0G2EQK1_PHACM|nr:putative f-actin-capping protein subunit alpha [Phaeomoniella chlamydospora]